MRTIVYVDGYNLYYGLLRRSSFKWLDLYSLFQHHVLKPESNVIEVRYYTAPVKKNMSDDPSSHTRQRIYLEALRKMPPHKVKIIEGRMEASTPFRRLVEPITCESGQNVEKAKVWSFTEKKSDVNLATDMLSDSWRQRCNQVVLCSNDTDLEGALSAIRNHLPNIKIGLVAPVVGGDRHMSADLKRHVHWSKTLSQVHLANAQLPQQIPCHSKPIVKPVGW